MPCHVVCKCELLLLIASDCLLNALFCMHVQLDAELDCSDAGTAAAASSIAASIIMSPRGMALYRPALSPLADANAAAAFSFAAADSSSSAAIGTDALAANSTTAGAADAVNSSQTDSNNTGDVLSGTPPKTGDAAATANSDDTALSSQQQQQQQQQQQRQQQLRSVMSAVTAAARLNRGNGNTYHSSSAVPAKRRRIYPVGRTQARQKWATREIAALDFLTSIPMRQEAKVSCYTLCLAYV
jgi:hypothetical protein